MEKEIPSKCILICNFIPSSILIFLSQFNLYIIQKPDGEEYDRDNDADLLTDTIPPLWWLENKACCYMLACLVHKDNPDISSDAASLPSGGTRIQQREDAAAEVNEERTLARAARPASESEMVDIQFKKAKIRGMNAHVSEKEIKNILTQITAMKENKEFWIEAMGEEAFKFEMVNLLKLMPNVVGGLDGE